MPINNFLLPGAKTTPAYEVANSCRFNDGDNPSLKKTPSGAGSLTNWTFSCWVKRSTVSNAQQMIAMALASSGNDTQINFSSADQIEFFNRSGGSVNGMLLTNRKFRDVSAWYHIVAVWNSDDGTAGNRMRLYINGTEETSFATDTNPSADTESKFNSACEHVIGQANSGSADFDGYLAEVVYVDGSALTPSSFGEFDEDSPTIWKPKDVSGLTFGTNGFYLDFEKDGTNTAFVDEGHNSLSVTTTGNATHSFVQSKIGGSSIKFDGTGDKIITGTHSDFNTGTGDWTIEFWAYKSATMTNHQIANTSDGSTEGHGWQIEYTSNILGLYIYDLANDWTHYAVEDDEASTGNWHHYAWVRDSNVHKLYRNGTLQSSSTTDSSGITPTTNGWVFGEHTSDASRDFNGYLDQIRISDNARYSSNFTAPTSEFSSDSNTLLLIQSKASNLISADVSGQGNHFSTSNITIEDQCVDSPTNNFATLNSLIDKGITYSEGNVHYKNTHGSNSEYTHPTIEQVSNGRWYYEIRMGSANNDSAYEYFGSPTAYVKTDDNIHPSGTTTVSSGDIFGFYLNYEDGQITIHRNGSQIYQSSSGISLSTTTAQIAAFNNTEYQANFGNPSYSISSGNADANGYGNFEYSPVLSSVNFYSLCTKNLAEFG